MSQALSHASQKPVLDKTGEAKDSAHPKRCAYALQNHPSNKLTASGKMNSPLQMGDEKAIGLYRMIRNYVAEAREDHRRLAQAPPQNLEFIIAARALLNTP
jgi:hypothetical protein